MRSLIQSGAIVGGVLVLAACSNDEITSGKVTDEDGNTTEYSVKDEGGGDTSISIKGEDGSVDIRSGGGLEKELPYGLSLPSGAKIQSTMQLNQGPNGEKATAVSFSTDRPVKDVVAMYKKQATDAGFKINSEMTTDATQMFFAERGDKTINVTAISGEEGETVINLIAGQN